MPKSKKSPQEVFTLQYCRHLKPKIGRWANELSRTIGQLLGKRGRKRNIVLSILKEIAWDYPNKYNKLLDGYVGQKHWSKLLRREEVKETDELRRIRASTQTKTSRSMAA